MVIQVINHNILIYYAFYKFNYFRLSYEYISEYLDFNRIQNIKIANRLLVRSILPLKYF